MYKFLNLTEINEEYQKIAYSEDELSKNVRECLHPIKQQSTYDYPGLLLRGSEWLFEHIKIYQPKTYAALHKNNPLILVGERTWPDRLDKTKFHWAANAFIQLDNRYIVVHPEFKGATIEERGENHPSYKRYCSLPKKIAAAYYARIDGFELANKLPLNSMESRVFPTKISAWQRVESLFARDIKKTKLLIAALGSVADNTVASSGNLGSDFRVLIDTRPQDDYSCNGHVLVVQENSLSENVFYFSLNDPTSIFLIENPEILIDHYVANVIACGSEQFNFSPYIRKA